MASVEHNSKHLLTSSILASMIEEKVLKRMKIIKLGFALVKVKCGAAT